MLTESLAQNLVCSPRTGGDAAMPKLVTETKLREAVQNQTFIVGGEPGSVEGIKYDFHMGTQFLKSSYRRPIDISDLSAAERNSLCIAPGEVVFVLTKEKLNLPNNIMAMLSPKRKLAHSGIIILGGQAVDPLYSGVLWVGLYNFSSTPFALAPGRKLIAAVFYELQDDEVGDFAVPEATHITGFPDELVALINQYKPVELKGLQEQLAETRRELEALKNDMASDKTWRDEFKNGLNELKQTVVETSRNLTQLATSLERESSLRAQEDKAITDRINRQSTMLFGFRLFWAAVILVVVAILGALADHYVPKAFGWDKPQQTTQTP